MSAPVTHATPASNGEREHYLPLPEKAPAHGALWPAVQQAEAEITRLATDAHIRQRPAPVNMAQPPAPADASTLTHAHLAAILAAQQEQTTALGALHTAVVGLLAWLKDQRRQPVYQTIYLDNVRPFRLYNRDHCHAYLLVTAAISLSVQVPLLGTITRSITPDWNRLDYPDATELLLTSGTNTPAILLLTDTPLAFPN